MHESSSSDRRQPGGLTNREQLDNSVCDAPGRPWLEGVDVERATVYFYQPNCGSWTCQHCSVVNTRRWSWIVASGAGTLLERGQQISFTTLTSHERLSPDASIRVFPSAWMKLSRRARYHAKAGQYVLVPERHESGVLHVHMLDTFNLGKRWWKDNGRECGLGYQADSGFAETAGGAYAYASKYLSKQWGIPWPRNFRRIRTSQKFPRQTDDGEACQVAWSKVASEEDVLTLADRWELEGYQVKILSSSELADELRELRQSAIAD